MAKQKPTPKYAMSVTEQFGPILDLREVCSILKIGRSTAMKLLADGEFPIKPLAHTVKTKYRFPAHRVNEYISGGDRAAS